MKQILYLPILLLFLFQYKSSDAQEPVASLPSTVTLAECINFALKNQPLIQQSLIDEEIAEKDISIALSELYPQISGQANLSRYLKQPVSILNGQPVIFQPKNNSNFLVQADQFLFS